MEQHCENDHHAAAALSPSDCLAKSRMKDGVCLPGRTVEEHCRITGAVAARLFSALSPCALRLFPEHSDVTAAVHDIGKISPYFQAMIHEATHDLPRYPQLLSFAGALNPLGHASVSQAALMETSRAVAEIAGWHHGAPPEACAADDEICGGEPWQAARLALLSRLCEGRTLPARLSREQKTLLKGFTAVADWISSGTIFDDPGEDWRPFVAQAVDEAGFRPVSFVPGLSFENVFGFAPNAVQKAMMQIVSGPGVYALEAPMGMGKTEAALFAAYRLLSEGKAGGLYFALPTRLTSNRIFERLLPFLRATLAPGSRHAATMLLHGASWLYATHNDTGKLASSWFEQSKRGLLAPFGAGTLDQALMSVINVRHAAVRSFGLAGKVVIFDEVHSYDAYTGTLLDALIRHLEQIGCTVILLSATLTRSRLADMMGCARDGSDAYPLITARCADDASGQVRELTVPEEDAPKNHAVHIRLDASDEEAVNEALLRAEDGQQVLLIENSVAEAQNAFRLFAARAAGMGVETGLLHSRFTPSDRERNERRWTELYGKRSDERSLCGRILVGTQVLEQSLDIDADFLVTRLCPSDMLFQRMGRLWRHEQVMRPGGAKREAWALAPSLREALSSPASAFGVSGVIYAPYVLARTLEVWSGRTGVLLPADIRPMLEATYADRNEEPSPGMSAVQKDLLRKKESLRMLALSSQSRGQQRPEETAGTRASEEETCPVLLVRALNGKECLTADEQRLCLDRLPEHRREVSAALFANIVRIRRKNNPFTQPVNTDKRLRRLFSWHLPVKENYEPLYLGKIRPDDSVEEVASGTVCGRYTSRAGWEPVLPS